MGDVIALDGVITRVILSHGRGRFRATWDFRLGDFVRVRRFDSRYAYTDDRAREVLRLTARTVLAEGLRKPRPLDAFELVARPEVPR